MSIREQRIRKITQLYYSRHDVQNAMLEFSKNREICPRYFEGFGKRPDSLQYPGDIFELVKKGATSFHCSEELWDDPLKIVTGMTEQQSNELRTGWDLLIDIDSKYIDYSKIMAEIIVKMLNFHGIKNIGIKFSGSKGFHILIPWKAFPKQVNEINTSDNFPEYPRIITKYIEHRVKGEVTEKINDLFYKDKYGDVSQYIKREAGVTKGMLDTIPSRQMNAETSGAIMAKIENLKYDEKSFNTEVMPDLVLVSPRHLFRMPYSLHEKTALASVVLKPDEIEKFELKDANPLKAKVKDFMPDSEEDEASELLIQALDWHKDEEIRIGKSTEKITGKYADFKPIQLKNLADNHFPPCVKKILQGLTDGRKRALFVLINLFRSTGMDKDELEKRIEDWNSKNKPPIKQGYIQSQLMWSYKRKPLLPPNCKEFYNGIGVCLPDNFCRMIKNPVNYVVRKNFIGNKKKK